uniref:DUF4371 domain-containing protein n=1 Tax=Macrostomum lignano TaxID=282301 RepID=A0A1I8GFG7_9PLAT
QDQIEDEYRNRNLRPTVTPSQSQTQTPSRQANDNENEIEEVHEVLPVDKEYEKISQTENMAQLLKSPSIGIEAIGEDFIVYCKCCFDVLSKAQPMPTNYSVADAFRFLNPGLGPNSISKGKFCSGRLVKAAEMKELHESPTAFSKFRYSVKSHFSGVNGMGHAKAKKKVDNDKGRLTRNQKVVRNLVRSAAYHIESACAAMHYELTIVLLSESGAEVGNIGHGFQFGRQLWDLLEFCVDRDASRFMREPLPSTGLPPMMCLTCDKSTPTRTTNQAVLILLRDSTGVALAIPAGAPPIYNESMEAGGTALAKLLFQTLRNMDPPLRSIVGVVADGQYIANGNFLSEVRMQLGVDADSESDLPISWDAAHYLNLAVTDVRDARNKEFFRRFVELHTAFRDENPQCRDDETTQYQMFGCDFVFDLLALLDLMDPLRQLMEIVQDIRQPHWKCAMLLPKVLSFLEHRSTVFRVSDYPRLKDCYDAIRPGGQFDGVPLLDGWLVTGTGNGIDWFARDRADMEADITQLAADLRTSLAKRFQKCNNDAAGKAAVMDATAVLQLLSSDDVDVSVELFTTSDAAKELVQQAERHSNLELKAVLTRRYLASYVNCLHNAFKTGVGRETWLIPAITEP